MKTERVEKAHALFRQQYTRSLDAPIQQYSYRGDRDETAFGELVADKNAPNPEEQVVSALFDKQVNEQVREIVSSLDPREADIIRRRFGFDGEPETLAEIGLDLGISRERIRQLEAKALRSLRYRARSLRDSLRE